MRKEILDGLNRVAANATRTDGHPEKVAAKLEANDRDHTQDMPVALVATPDEVDYRSALRAISDRTFCRSEKWLQQQWRANRSVAHPVIIEFERVLIRKLRSLDVPMYAHCVYRSPEEQNAAFKRGVSNARAGQSAHNYGMAVDIVHGVKGWEISKMSWKILGHLGKEVAKQKGFNLTWGGDWKFWDPAHWELADWKTLARK